MAVAGENPPETSAPVAAEPEEAGNTEVEAPQPRRKRARKVPSEEAPADATAAPSGEASSAAAATSSSAKSAVEGESASAADRTPVSGAAASSAAAAASALVSSASPAGASPAASSAPKRKSRRQVQVQQPLPPDLSAYGEDGRLMSMFIGRELHKKPEARKIALSDWLIRESFYDEHLDEFINRFAPSAAIPLEDTADELMIAKLKDFELAMMTKAKVEKLENNVICSQGDPYILRDSLLSALKELNAPKRKLGLKGEEQLTPEIIALLKQKRQIRLRGVVCDCLEGIWRAGVGGEILKACMSEVHTLIDRFESERDDIRAAFGGPSWHKLKKLVRSIEEEQPDLMPKRKRIDQAVGKGTKALIQQALDDMGGSATTLEIIRWVEGHPEHVGGEMKCNINQKEKERCKSFVGSRVWHQTLRNVLSQNFAKSSKKRGDDGFYTWSAKSKEMDLDDAKPVEDGGEDGEAAGEGVLVTADVDAGAEPEALPLPVADQPSSPIVS